MKKVIKIIVLILFSIWPAIVFIDLIQLFPNSLDFFGGLTIIALVVPIFILAGILSQVMDFKNNNICYYVSLGYLLFVNLNLIYIIYSLDFSAMGTILK